MLRGGLVGALWEDSGANDSGTDVSLELRQNWETLPSGYHDHGSPTQVSLSKHLEA